MTTSSNKSSHKRSDRKNTNSSRSSSSSSNNYSNGYSNSYSNDRRGDFRSSDRGDRSDRGERRSPRFNSDSQEPYKPTPKWPQAQDLMDLEGLVRKITSFEYPADQYLKFYFKQNPKLGKQQRFFISEVIFNLLRHYNRFEYWANEHFNQLKKNYADSIPMSSTSWRRMMILALAETKEEWLHVCKNQEQHWINAIIKTQSNKVKFAEHIKYCLPEWLWNNLVEQYEQPWLLAQGLMEKASLDVRVNRIKATPKEVMEKLTTEEVVCEKIPATDYGIRLQTKRSLYHHDLFEQGAIEIQDGASQIAAALLKAKRGDMVVDFCAGAGGKTLAIGAAMDGRGRIYAVDIHDKRLEKLKPRLKRSGLNNVYTTLIQHEGDAKLKKLYGKIDKVFVDSPCSGFGTLRRNPDLKWRYGVVDLQNLQTQQLNILTNASKLLKEGGRLVYATCSILKQENEDIVQAFLNQNPEFKLLPVSTELSPEQQSVLEQGDYLKLYPHVHQTDGFFAAVMEKTKPA